MVKRIHLIVLLVLLQAVTGVAVLYAQSMTSASGIVKDSITGEPLAFVSVYFDGSTIGAMTDDNGAFALQNDKGYNKLAVASLGYDTKILDLKTGQKNDGLTID
ncbi:carboxypeptidase-like regulatory domain-containing protein, partial [Parabacteroides goldsteinii]